MYKFFYNFYKKEMFHPTFLFGIWVNPFFIIRKGLAKGVLNIAKYIKGGKLLDVGCGSKPYREFFSVDEYVGIDIKISGHNHHHSKVDFFYDGKKIPFNDHVFDYVFSSEVFEHVFEIDSFIVEINRVLKKGGLLAFTCPFVWDEHEKPFDFARYTSFAIEHLMKKHGFKIIDFEKSTSYI